MSQYKKTNTGWLIVAYDDGSEGLTKTFQCADLMAVLKTAQCGMNIVVQQDATDLIMMTINAYEYGVSILPKEGGKITDYEMSLSRFLDEAISHA